MGDILRATIVCVDGESILEAFNRCSRHFMITPEHGRAKNDFGTSVPVPRMLLNVIVDDPDSLPVIAEIQIHLLGIYKIKELNHRCECLRARASSDLMPGLSFTVPLNICSSADYEVRRAPSMEALLKENQKFIHEHELCDLSLDATPVRPAFEMSERNNSGDVEMQLIAWQKTNPMHELGAAQVASAPQQRGPELTSRISL